VVGSAECGGNSLVLPAWDIVEVNTDSPVLEPMDAGISRVTYKRTPINTDTRFDVIYKYNGDDPLAVAYGNHNVCILTIGKSNQRFQVKAIVEHNETVKHKA